MPAPSDVAQALRDALYQRVAAERANRGEVHQPEDVSPLVRSLAGAQELLNDYARAFTRAATIAKDELDEELFTAVGNQDGIPMSGLKVPDLDGTDILFSLIKPNTHGIDERTVVAAVIGHTIATRRGSEPSQNDDETNHEYDQRYEGWMADVIEQAVDQVLDLGSYALQVSKVKAYAVALAGQGEDNLAGVVRGSINTTATYRGIKVERKERKEKP